MIDVLITIVKGLCLIGMVVGLLGLMREILVGSTTHYIPYSTEAIEHNDYFKEKLDFITEERFLLLSKKTLAVLVFDTEHCCFKCLSSLDVDLKKHLTIFTKQELNDFGIYEEDEEYKWFKVEYLVESEELDEQDN